MVYVKPPKRKLKWFEEHSQLRMCSERFCLRLISPQEISPQEKRERMNTLCEKHKQYLKFAVSEMFNNWCKPSTPRGSTPSRGFGVKSKSRVTVRKISPVAKRLTGCDLLAEATRQRWIREHEEDEKRAALKLAQR